MRTLALALSIALPAALNAQWSVGLSVGVGRHFGGAVSTADSTPGSVHPGRPTLVGLTVGHDWGAVRADLGLSYASPGLAVEIPGGVFVDTKAVRFYSGSPEVTVRLFRVGDDGVLRVGGGGDVVAWAITDGDTRVRVGGHVTAVYEWPVTRRFLGDVQAGVSLTPSLFDASDLSPPFERRSLLRPSVTIGIRYR
ncbi:MAG TPA: hypothetical protein VH163_10975 [Gemmatimonadales bacterium]|jgi:hypothetical protein|nr:hypothetical protein [Gemmatimonadales bacterium]